MFEMIENYDVQKVRNEGKLEVASNLLKEGMDLPFIVKITGLTLDEIKKLRAEIREENH